MTLSEFDDWAKDTISSVIKAKEEFLYIKTDNKMKYSVDVDNSFNMVINKVDKEFDRLSKIIKSQNTPPNIKIGNIDIVSMASLDFKQQVLDKYKIEDIPELSITSSDIMYASMFVSNRSNSSEFEKDMKKISLVSPMTDADIKKLKGNKPTLFVEKLPNNRFALKYSSKFIAECIVEDYIYHFSGMYGYEHYKGALTSFCYLIGHELLHYRNNHFAPHMTKTIMKLLHPVEHGNNGEKSKNYIDSILYDESQKFIELQNNSYMSKILDVGAVNRGIGRFHVNKSTDYGGLYSGYLRLDYQDKLTDSSGRSISFVEFLQEMKDTESWSFKGVQIVCDFRPLDMHILAVRGRHEHFDKDEIVWPFITPLPTDNDLQKFLSLLILTYLPVNSSMETEPEVIDGYQVGDAVVVKKTGKRGIITSIVNGEITVVLDGHISVRDKIIKLIDDAPLVRVSHTISDFFSKRGNDVYYTRDIGSVIEKVDAEEVLEEILAMLSSDPEISKKISRRKKE